MESNAISKKKVIVDAFLNIIAAGLPIVVIQLIAFPMIARLTSVSDYGLMITIYAIIMFIPNIIGNALANLRLVKDIKYKDKEGDFNRIVIMYGGVVIFYSVLIALVYYVDIIRAICFIITAILTYINAYYEVSFSLHLNFKFRLYVRISLVIGYIIGLIGFYLFHSWELIFLFGQVVTSIFIIKNSCLYKESIEKTELYAETRRDAISLVLSSCVSSSLDYFDRILLYPLLGASVVSVYNIACTVGKIVLMITPPINSLILSYLSKIEHVKKRTIYSMIIVVTIFCTVLYFLCVWISKYILMILYPTYMDEAILLVPITTITVMISAIGGVVRVFVMRYCRMQWQTIINISTLAFYLLISMILMYFYGIWGFCVGNLLSYLFRLIFYMLVFHFDYKEMSIEAKE